MDNLTERKSILLVNSGGIVGNLLNSINAKNLPPYIKLVDVETFSQSIDLAPPDQNGHAGIIIFDIPDESESERVKRLVGAHPGYSNTPLVDIHTSSATELNQLVEDIHAITDRKFNFPSSVNNPVDGKEMLLIPAGSYKRRRGISPDYSMAHGSPKIESFTNALYMDKYPVTRLEYQVFLDQSGYPPPARWQLYEAEDKFAQHPAVGITWQDVIAYAKWSGKRFPTPNEWEKAAFGEDGLMFPWGDEYSPKLCNILESNIGATTPVGTHSPAGDSPYGICDLFGNVWEWVYDWTASPDNRMLMGGAWDTPLEYLLPPYYARVRANPGLAGQNFGFRLVISPNLSMI